jgi:hypothetical protein
VRVREHTAGRRPVSNVGPAAEAGDEVFRVGFLNLYGAASGSEHYAERVEAEEEGAKEERYPAQEEDAGEGAGSAVDEGEMPGPGFIDLGASSGPNEEADAGSDDRKTEEPSAAERQLGQLLPALEGEEG